LAGGEAARAPLAGTRLRLVGQAWLAAAPNPLAGGFFPAFLPRFIDPGRAFWPQVPILEATSAGLAFAVILLCGLLAARLGRGGAGELGAVDGPGRPRRGRGSGRREGEARGAPGPPLGRH
jgi:threonine/homoserine/homoserine lactone efflux protein